MPCSELPQGLKLAKGYTYQPPRFLYGWAMGFREAYDFGTALGIFAPAPADEDSPSVECFRLCRGLNEILVRGAPKFMQYMKFVSVEPVFGKRTGGEPVKICIVVADSYRTGHRTPSAAALERLHSILEKLGLPSHSAWTREPMWWLDMFHSEWRCLNPKYYYGTP